MKVQLYTLREAAQLVDLSPDTLRKYINLGKIKGYKKGRDWLLDAKAINKLLERRTKNA